MYIYIQWNFYNPDTIGTSSKCPVYGGVPISEVCQEIVDSDCRCKKRLPSGCHQFLNIYTHTYTVWLDHMAIMSQTTSREMPGNLGCYEIRSFIRGAHACKEHWQQRNEHTLKLKKELGNCRDKLITLQE